MDQNYRNELLIKREKWLRDIELYKSFLKRGYSTLDGKLGAEEYISMAENNIKDINQKLFKKKIK